MVEKVSEQAIKKILYVSHDIENSGANRSLLGIIKNLKNKSDLSFLVLVPGKGSFTEELDKLNIEYIVQKYYGYYYENTVKGWIFDKIKILLNIYYKIKIYNKIKNLKIDLIHVNCSVVHNIGSFLKKIKKTPYILHIREYGKEDHNLRYRINFEYVANYINENTNEVIFISKDLSKKFLPFLNKTKINIIYNGIDFDKKNIYNKNYNNDVLKICVLGTINDGKNQLEAIKAMKIILKKYKYLKLYIVGKGNKRYIQKLEEFIEDNFLKENILFCEYMKDPMIFLENIDIGIVPSRKEAFGRVTVEFMLNKIPVIASNTGANSEIISSYEEGIIYPLGNVEALSKAIEFLLVEKNRKVLGENGYKKAINYFTAERNANEIYNIYKKYLY